MYMYTQMCKYTYQVHFCCLCLYGFRADHLILGKHPWEMLSRLLSAVCSSLSRNVVLWKIVPFLVSISIDTTIVQIPLCSHFYERLFHTRLPGILALCDLSTPFSGMFPELWICELWCGCIHWGWVPHNWLISALCLVVVCCDGFCLL